MEQKPLFEFDTISIRYNRQPGHKKGWLQQVVTVFDEEGMATVWIQAETFKTHPRRSQMVDRATLAYRERDSRPYGDNYPAPEGDVEYLISLT